MADEEGNAEEDTGSAPKKKKFGSESLLLVILIINTLVMVGVAYLQFVAFQADKDRSSVRDVLMADVRDGVLGAGDGPRPRAVDGFLFSMDGFTANLAQGDGPRRFVRLKLVLKFSKDSKEEEFNARKPQIRDVIISTLNSKRAEDLLKLEGKNYLKEEIKSAINSFLVDGHVVDIYYIGFQVN